MLTVQRGRPPIRTICHHVIDTRGQDQRASRASREWKVHRKRRRQVGGRRGGGEIKDEWLTGGRQDQRIFNDSRCYGRHGRCYVLIAKNIYDPTCLKTYYSSFSIRSSLRTGNFTQPKLYSFPFVITLSMPLVVSKSPASVCSIFRLPMKTVDHSILLDRLSLWFGVHGTALNWFNLTCQIVCSG